VNKDDLKQQQMLNVADEWLSKVFTHHRSVLDTNDKWEEWRTDEVNENRMSEEGEGWKLVQWC
jgi:hypothetical protein